MDFVLTEDQTAARIGSVIRAAREAVGLDAKELARRAGIHAVTLSNIETGKKAARFDTILRLADVLGIDTGAFKPKSDAPPVAKPRAGASALPGSAIGERREATPDVKHVRGEPEGNAKPPADHDARLRLIEERVDLLTRALRRGLGAALDAAEAEQAERGHQAPHTDSAT